MAQRNRIDAATRREAYYTNLPPGNYTFRVTASNVDASPNESANPVMFVLEIVAALTTVIFVRDLRQGSLP